MLAQDVTERVKFVPYLMGGDDIYANYNEQQDELYIQFKNPLQITEREITANDIAWRIEGNAVVGVTVKNASNKHLFE